MGRTDPRSAQTRSRAPIIHSCQVIEYSPEPFPASRACNLLAKDNCRATLPDETVELGPQVPSVHDAPAFSDGGEWLTRATARPNSGNVIWHLGELEGIGPSADTGEEVTLGVPFDVCGCDMFNIPFVNIACWQ
jgi:hypothetical protein